jgi:Cellulose biosynthesis protein BcsS
MRCVRVMSVFWAAAILACGSVPAVADPSLADILPPGGLSNSTSSERFLYYSGFDLWRNSGSIYGGLQWAPNGINNNGFTLKLLLAEGFYRYRSGSTDTRGANFLASALPGWRIKQDNFEVKIFAGLDLQHHRLSPDDLGNNLRGTHAGLRVNADLWWEPMARIMLASSLSASTIGNSYGIRVATGWQVMESFWAGPETETSGNDVYRQYRIGAHVTSLRTGAFEWSLGAGYVQDNDQHSGGYARIGLLTRQ